MNGRMRREEKDELILKLAIVLNEMVLYTRIDDADLDVYAIIMKHPAVQDRLEAGRQRAKDSANAASPKLSTIGESGYEPC